MKSPLTALKVNSEIKGVFFDSADTLLHMEPSPSQIFADACAKCGLMVKEREISEIYYRLQNEYKLRTDREHTQEERKAHFENFNNRIFKEIGVKAPVSEIHQIIYAEFSRKRKWVPFPEVREVLNFINKTNLIIGLVANWDTGLKKQYEKLNLASFFDFFVASTEVGFEKPDPQIFRIALSQVSLNANEVIYVGNELEADIFCPQKIGMTPVLVDRDSKIESDRVDCLKINNLKQLIPYLNDVIA